MANEDNASRVLLYQQNKDIALRNEIVMANMGLVRSVAMSMRNMYVKYGEVEDVVNEGVIALMDAIESYSPDKGAKFETYATLRIRGAIIDYIRQQDWVPRNVRKFARALDKANGLLYNLYGRAPSTAELAAYMTISEDKLLKMMSECSGMLTMSFEELLYEDNIDEGNSPATDDSTDSKLLREEMKKVIISAIDELNEKERQVVTLYYYKNMKYSDIAKALGITEGRVCQIHSKAVLRLKASLSPYFKGNSE